jgi:hypothetical protein
MSTGGERTTGRGGPSSTTRHYPLWPFDAVIPNAAALGSASDTERGQSKLQRLGRHQEREAAAGAVHVELNRVARARERCRRFAREHAGRVPLHQARA